MLKLNLLCSQTLDGINGSKGPCTYFCEIKIKQNWNCSRSYPSSHLHFFFFFFGIVSVAQRVQKEFDTYVNLSVPPHDLKRLFLFTAASAEYCLKSQIMKYQNNARWWFFGWWCEYILRWTSVVIGYYWSKLQLVTYWCMNSCVFLHGAEFIEMAVGRISKYNIIELSSSITPMYKHAMRKDIWATYQECWLPCTV